jgi:segregation and condensation protein B
MTEEVIDQPEVVEEVKTEAKPEKVQKAVMTEEELFQNLRILEAVLFTSQDLMSQRDLSQFFPANTDIELLLEHMQQNYENRGVHLVKRGNGWGLRTAPDLAEKLEVRKVETRQLSRAAIETLAIIAYHQPVTRAEIEQIRGVSISKTTFEVLVGETLIKPGKRRDVPGRPLTWITTQNFLDSFGLESIKELPNLQELKEAGLLSVMPPQLSAEQEQASLPLGLKDDNEEEVEAVEEYSDDEFDNAESTSDTGEEENA